MRLLPIRHRKGAGLPPGNRQCIDCTAWKPFSDFYERSGSRGSKHNICKACYSTRQKKWRKANVKQ